MTSALTSDIIYYAASIISFAVALTGHEAAHGFAAYKLGDPTAKRAGRLSLNPLRHIDPFGTVILPLLLMVMHLPIFGYAKPVPYNPSYFKNPRKGDAITGFAGPAANLVMALVACGVAWLLVTLGVSRADTVAVYSIFMFLATFTMVNLYLMFFNLIPIPPLDGSSIFAVFLPARLLPQWYSIQRYAFPIFMIAILVLPSVIGFNPFSWYLNVTAGNLANALFPIRIA